MTQEHAIRLFSTGSFCVRVLEDSFLDKLYYLVETLTQENAIRLFSTGSFCVRVLEDKFLDKLYHLVETLTQEHAIRLFSTGSFCVRVLEDAFLDKLFFLVEKLTQKYAIKLFSTGSFSVRVLEDSFLNKLYTFIDVLPKIDAMQLFSTESFCVRVQQTNFIILFENFVTEVGQTNTVKLFSNGAFCCRVQNTQFMNIFREILQLFGIMNVILLFGIQSFCTHVQNAKFMDTFYSLKQSHGIEIVIQLFRNTGINQQVNDDVYFEKLCAFLDDFGEDAKNLFKSREFGMHLNDNGFLQHVQKDIRQYDSLTFASLYRNSAYISRICNQDFWKYVHELQQHFPCQPIVEFLFNSTFVTNIKNAKIMIEMWNQFIKTESKQYTDSTILFKCGTFCTQTLKNSKNNIIDDFKKISNNDEATNKLLQAAKKNFNIFFVILAKRYGMDKAIMLCSTKTFINPMMENFDVITNKLNMLVEACGEQNAFKLFKCSAFVNRFVHQDFYEFFIQQIQTSQHQTVIIDFFADESFCIQTSNYRYENKTDDHENKLCQEYAIELINEIILLSKVDDMSLHHFLDICKKTSDQYQKNPLFPSILSCDCKLCIKCDRQNPKVQDCSSSVQIYSEICECSKCFDMNKSTILQCRRKNFLLSLTTLLPHTILNKKFICQESK